MAERVSKYGRHLTERVQRQRDLPDSEQRSARLRKGGLESDSPRWCATCQKYGDHHTDRCSLAPLLARAEALAAAVTRFADTAACPDYLVDALVAYDATDEATPANTRAHGPVDDERSCQSKAGFSSSRSGGGA